MASKKRVNQPAKWFRESVARERGWQEDSYKWEDLGDRRQALESLARVAEEREFREREIAYLTQSIRDLRKWVKGYEAKDGYSLKRSEVARLSAAQVKRIHKQAPILHQELSSPHVRVIPRTAKQRKALETYTGQTWIKGRKAFAVHVESPETTKVKLVPGATKTSPVTVEVRHEVKGGYVSERVFLFANYGGRPVTFKQMARITSRMLPDMPDGYYVLISSNHGAINGATERDMLVERMRTDWTIYDVAPTSAGSKDSRGLAETVVGLKFVSSSQRAAEKEYRTRQTRRMHMRAVRAAQRMKALRQARRKSK